MNSHAIFIPYYRDLPSQLFLNKFVILIDSLRDSMKSKNFPKALQQDVISLEKMQVTLKNCIREEEEARPRHQLDFKLYQEKSDLEKANAQYDLDFSKKFAEYKISIGRIREDLAEIHTTIEEIQSKGMLEETRKLVLNNQLHLDISDEIGKLREEINEVSCLQRFFCCCTLSDVKESKIKLAHLEVQRKNLSSTDQRKQLDTMVVNLQKKRENLKLQLLSVENNPPQKTDNTFRERLYRIKGIIEGNASAYYNALTPNTMLQFIRIYEVLRVAHAKCEEQVVSVVSSERTPFLDTRNNIQAAFDQCAFEVRTAFKKFYCPELQYATLEECYQIFCSLSQEERTTAVAGNASAEILTKFKLGNPLALT